MTTWHPKKITALLNTKIRKKPCRFQIIDDETITLPEFENCGISSPTDHQVCEILTIYENKYAELLDKIEDVLANYKFKLYVILDTDGEISIIICKWSYQDKSIEVNRNPLNIRRN